MSTAAETVEATESAISEEYEGGVMVMCELDESELYSELEIFILSYLYQGGSLDQTLT